MATARPALEHREVVPVSPIAITPEGHISNAHDESIPAPPCRPRRTSWAEVELAEPCIVPSGTARRSALLEPGQEVQHRAVVLFAG
jgi:hypothetical protein